MLDELTRIGFRRRVVRRATGGPKAEPGADAGPAAPLRRRLDSKDGPIRQCNDLFGCSTVRLFCRTMASRGAAAATSARYARLRRWTFAAVRVERFVGRRAE